MVDQLLPAGSPALLALVEAATATEQRDRPSLAEFRSQWRAASTVYTVVPPKPTSLPSGSR